MRHSCLLLLQVAFVSTIAVYGCTVYQKPSPFHDVPFQERSQSQVDGDVKVTVAVLSAEESRRLFGVNLAGKNIQPVWVRVQNAGIAYLWLMFSSMDPDYFSPLEAAYVFHGTLGGSLNNKIDPDVDEAMYALLEDLVNSQQVSKIGYVRGTGRASRAKPRHNLTGDPYFTDGFRAVLVFDRRLHSFTEIKFFDDWERGPAADKLKRLTINQQQDFDEGW